MINRRSFLSSSAAGAGLAIAPSLCLAAQRGGVSYDLVAEAGSAPLLGAEGPASRLWLYGGRSPGPLLRVRQGERINIRLQNNLTEPTSAHWHGIRIDNAMDGAPGITQDAVPPGGSFDYSFIAPDAGTYWYHSHNKSWEQMARGLYGPLIVEEREPLPLDQEFVLVIDDWRLDDDGQIHAASFGDLRDWSHGGRLGNWLTINGVSRPDFTARRGERLRLRLINSSNARILRLGFERLPVSLIALDGQWLGQSKEIAPGGALTLAPAQRADLLVDLNLEPGERAAIIETSRQEGIAIGNLFCDGETAAGLAGTPMPRLPRVGLPQPDLSDPVTLDLTMEGGAMGAMRSAVLDGEELTLRELAARGQVWALNGVAGMTETPLAAVRAGRSVVLHFDNQTAWPHAVHIHGHHFRVIARKGQPVADGAWRDTELVAAREKVTLAFVADNPGKWLIHCHMLEHQAAGMKTWFQVLT